MKAEIPENQASHIVCPVTLDLERAALKNDADIQALNPHAKCAALPKVNHDAREIYFTAQAQHSCHLTPIFNGSSGQNVSNDEAIALYRQQISGELNIVAQISEALKKVSEPVKNALNTLKALEKKRLNVAESIKQTMSEIDRASKMPPEFRTKALADLQRKAKRQQLVMDIISASKQEFKDMIGRTQLVQKALRSKRDEHMSLLRLARGELETLNARGELLKTSTGPDDGLRGDPAPENAGFKVDDGVRTNTAGDPHHFDDFAFDDHRRRTVNALPESDTTPVPPVPRAPSGPATDNDVIPDYTKYDPNTDTVDGQSDYRKLYTGHETQRPGVVSETRVRDVPYDPYKDIERYGDDLNGLFNAYDPKMDAARYGDFAPSTTAQNNAPNFPPPRPQPPTGVATTSSGFGGATPLSDGNRTSGYGGDYIGDNLGDYEIPGPPRPTTDTAQFNGTDGGPRDPIPVSDIASIGPGSTDNGATPATTPGGATNTGFNGNLPASDSFAGGNDSVGKEILTSPNDYNVHETPPPRTTPLGNTDLTEIAADDTNRQNQIYGGLGEPEVDLVAAAKAGDAKTLGADRSRTIVKSSPYTDGKDEDLDEEANAAVLVANAELTDLEKQFQETRNLAKAEQVKSTRLLARAGELDASGVDITGYSAGRKDRPTSLAMAGGSWDDTSVNYNGGNYSAASRMPGYSDDAEEGDEVAEELTPQELAAKEEEILKGELAETAEANYIVSEDGDTVIWKNRFSRNDLLARLAAAKDEESLLRNELDIMGQAETTAVAYRLDAVPSVPMRNLLAVDDGEFDLGETVLSKGDFLISDAEALATDTEIVDNESGNLNVLLGSGVSAAPTMDEIAATKSILPGEDRVAPQSLPPSAVTESDELDKDSVSAIISRVFGFEVDEPLKKNTGERSPANDTESKKSKKPGKKGPLQLKNPEPPVRIKVEVAPEILTDPKTVGPIVDAETPDKDPQPPHPKLKDQASLESIETEEKEGEDLAILQGIQDQIDMLVALQK